MRGLRLLADDLTGALDAAAEFVGAVGPVEVVWPGVPEAGPGSSLAIDIGTRELSEAEVRGRVAAAVPLLRNAGLAFKKVDSLIRGQTVPELAACWASGAWPRIVLAPAFPFQGRVTRAGRQMIRREQGWEAAGPNLLDALRALGVPASLARAGSAARLGVTIYDAESDRDLDAVVAGIGAGAPPLWCGTGGLASALAAPHRPPALAPLPRPVLGLFGTDQPATAAQLAACHPHWTTLPHQGTDHAASLRVGLERNGIALASLDLPPGLPRSDAALHIGAALAALARTLPMPGTLAVAGGETLRGLLSSLGAERLVVQGRAVPGVPVSVIRGGPWNGVTVLSKSGAFGPPTLLRDLLLAPFALERNTP